MSGPNETSGGWSQHGERGRGTFEDAGYGDTNEDRKTSTELPEGYSSVDVEGVSTQPEEDGRGASPHPYDSIPRQN